MDHLLTGGGFEHVEQPDAEEGGVLGVEGAVAPDRVVERRRVDQLGDDPGPLAVVDHVDDAGQARVVDRGHGPGLPAHPGRQRPALHVVEGVGEPQFLHGDEPLGDQILGPPQDPHAALVEYLDEAVAVIHHAAGSDNARHVSRA